jgi:hypothetical protein
MDSAGARRTRQLASEITLLAGLCARLCHASLDVEALKREEKRRR